MRAKVSINEDHCPMCGGSLDYYDKDWQGDQFCQEVECTACGFEFQQWYAIKFDGMTALAEDGDHEDIEKAKIIVEVRGGTAYCDDPNVEIIDYDNH